MSHLRPACLLLRCLIDGSRSPSSSIQQKDSPAGENNPVIGERLGNIREFALLALMAAAPLRRVIETHH